MKLYYEMPRRPNDFGIWSYEFDGNELYHVNDHSDHVYVHSDHVYDHSDHVYDHSDNDILLLLT